MTSEWVTHLSTSLTYSAHVNKVGRAYLKRTGTTHAVAHVILLLLINA